MLKHAFRTRAAFVRSAYVFATAGMLVLMPAWSASHAQKSTSTKKSRTTHPPPKSAKKPPRIVPSGKVEVHVVYDSSYMRARNIWIYTPPGYDAKRATPYPMVLAFDGDEYRDTMPLPQTLDTLLATHRAPAFVAMLVDDGASSVRVADLGNAAAMVTFLSKQLMPWVRSHWHVTTDPKQVIVTGSSAGGLGAAFVAFSRPDLFGNVWAQSPALWRGAEASNDAPYEWLTQQVKAAPRKDIRWMIDVGALEDHPTLGGAGPNFRDANRRFRDVLKAKGYMVTYTEVPGGNHAEKWWRQRLGVGIEELSRKMMN